MSDYKDRIDALLHKDIFDRVRRELITLHDALYDIDQICGGWYGINEYLKKLEMKHDKEQQT